MSASATPPATVTAHIEQLQRMGFDPTACARALQLTDNSLTRAIDLLLSNVDQPSGSAQLVDGSEVGASAASREPSPPPPRPDVTHDRPAPTGDARAIFSMGFPVDQVRRALSRCRDREAQAIELLLSGDVGSDETPSRARPPPSRVREPPSDWEGSAEEFDDVMRSTMSFYMAWCRSSLAGDVNPNRQHHERWVIQQLSECAAAFAQQIPSTRPSVDDPTGPDFVRISNSVGESPSSPFCASSSTPVTPPSTSSETMRHAQYMIASLGQRYPLIEREMRLVGTEQTLSINRDDIVNSTAAALDAIPDEKITGRFTIKFQGQSGTDAGGLTEDWLSLFMIEALDPYRHPPLFLLPWQSEGEASCLRLNHSMEAFGISADKQRSLLRAFGIVLGTCMRKGRYACNAYTLSKSLLQRLLRHDLPPGILPLKEEFPDAFNLLNSLFERREVWGADNQGTGESLEEYLSCAEQKYTAESKVADLMTLQHFLHNRIEIESSLVRAYDSADASCSSVGSTSSAASTGPYFDWLRSRAELLESIMQRETVVKKIKFAFHQQNSCLPSKDRHHPPSSSEIRQKLRERSGAPAAVAAGVAVTTPKNWHLRKHEFLDLIQKRQKLVMQLQAAQAALLESRAKQFEYEALDDVASALPSHVPPTTVLCTANFDSYCADLVSKRLHHDVTPLIDAMRAGFNLVQPDDPTLRSMDAAQLQHKLFPLSPVTLEEFKSNARVSATSNLEENQSLFWRVLAEDLSEEQMCNVFYFATNYHTLAGANRHVKIMFEAKGPRNLLPKASTCSWVLKLPDCFVPGDAAPDFPLSRARMRAVLTWAAAPEAQGYGFS